MNEELNTIGSRLKQIRLSKGISLEEAYKNTKMHMDVLKAIEDNKLDSFSAVYIKGFLKIYAQYLGINPQEILQQYQDMFLAKDQKIILKDDLPKLKAKINVNLFKSRKIQLGIKLFIIICIIFIFGRMISAFRNKKRISPKVKAEDAAKKISSVARKSGPVKLAIRVEEDCWVQIKCDGKKIYEGILTKGMKESWNAKEKIELSVGNAGGIEIEVDDKILSPLGRKGQVLRNITITADGISTIDKRR